MQVQDRGKRRGRRPTRPDPDSGATAFFAARLLRLKEEAGNPSYAEMSSVLGAAASKSSLAGAAQGRRLPSWETTWEFVRVLAVDRLGHDAERTERQWRDLWERAKAASSGDGAATGADGKDGDTTDRPISDGDITDGGITDRGTPDGDPADESPADGARAAAVTVTSSPPAASTASEAGTEAVSVPVPVPVRSARRRRVPAVPAALVVLVGVAASALIVVAGPMLLSPATDPPATGVERGALRPAPAASATPRDDSLFVGDITYPDGSTVRPGSSFTKVWRIRNTGTTSWEGRRLARINAASCRSPASVGVPPTAPGQTVDIEVRVRASDRPGSCRIYWKMTDARGRELFPDKRPVFLDVRVEAP
ncbi:hypothetical protein GCM10017673_44010 [Streptosporangium violaceochromogenes]|nr:hypothetical protein GCM10017673_44010 [Streptosporangium violaceochromogenes]